MKLINKSFFKFAIVGFINTIFTITAGFILYNFFNMGYWGSSIIIYIIGSFISYYLNKKYTFKYSGSTFELMPLIRFSIVIAVSYLISFSVSKIIFPYFIERLIKSDDFRIIEQFTMVCAMCIFTLINYFGQKLFVFNSKFKKNK